MCARKHRFLPFGRRKLRLQPKSKRHFLRCPMPTPKAFVFIAIFAADSRPMKPFFFIRRWWSATRGLMLSPRRAEPENLRMLRCGCGILGSAPASSMETSRSFDVTKTDFSLSELRGAEKKDGRSMHPLRWRRFAFLYAGRQTV